MIRLDGFHAIHIIVKNGNVTLYGVVNNQIDAAIAYMQANSTPGVFSVDNDLDRSGPPQIRIGRSLGILFYPPAPPNGS